MSYVSLAYQLGCKYAAEQFEKVAAGAELVRVARGLPQVLSRGGVPAVIDAASREAAPSMLRHLTNPLLGGAVGAGAGALAGGEDNRLRGALIGAGIGAGAGAGARIGKGLNLRSLEQSGKALHPALAGGLGVAGGGLLGGVMGRGVAPAHEEQSWTKKLRGMLPF